MFLGHYALALTAKKIKPRENIGIYFLACQLLDLIWPILVLLNVELVSVKQGITEFTPLEFVHYPYSHSLFMSVVWGLFLSFIFFLNKKSIKTLILIFTLVVSHWILDFITHTKDLPLMLNSETKVGLGLWNYYYSSFAFESGMFTIGIYLYIHSKRKLNEKINKSFWYLIVFLTIIHFANAFAPKPIEGTPASAIAAPALAMWLLVIWAYYSDKIKEKI